MGEKRKRGRKEEKKTKQKTKINIKHVAMYHGVAGQAGLQLEDFVQPDRLGLGQLLLRHANHKLDGGVSVVLLVVIDEGGGLVSALQHGLQHRLLVGLHTGARGNKQQGGLVEVAKVPPPDA